MILLIALGTAGGYAIWRHVRQSVLAAADYRLDLDDFEITPVPKWIHSDVRLEAVQNASLDGGPSILEEDLVERIDKAFGAHPWVARVERVSKRHPARVKVDLVYRRPVCMVELPRLAELPEGGLYPVDAEGVLLPTKDFTPIEGQEYPRLCEVTTLPMGSPGMKWGDARVAGGAMVAAALVDAWKTLKLSRIVPSAGPASGTDEHTFELWTAGGTQVIWGSAVAMPGERPAAAKVDQLLRYAAEHGGLEGSAGPQVFDVRQWEADRITPRTASRPMRTAP